MPTPMLFHSFVHLYAEKKCDKYDSWCLLSIHKKYKPISIRISTSVLVSICHRAFMRKPHRAFNKQLDFCAILKTSLKLFCRSYFGN